MVNGGGSVSILQQELPIATLRGGVSSSHSLPHAAGRCLLGFLDNSIISLSFGSQLALERAHALLQQRDLVLMMPRADDCVPLRRDGLKGDTDHRLDL